ncbi:hypothetical protein BaRGS_00014145, partial [Batillaria attramentaria]
WRCKAISVEINKLMLPVGMNPLVHLCRYLSHWTKGTIVYLLGSTDNVKSRVD